MTFPSLSKRTREETALISVEPVLGCFSLVSCLINYCQWLSALNALSVVFPPCPTPNIRLIYGVLSDDSNRKLTGLLNLFPQVKSQLEKEEHRIDEFRPFRDPSVVLGSTYG